MKSPIKIKVEDSEIVISKPFAKKAYSFGTPEYEMLQAVRRDYPGFAVVLREINKKTDAEHFLLSNSMSFGRPYILNIDGCIHDGWRSADWQSENQ